VEKCGAARQATDDNIICALYTGLLRLRKHSQIIYNYCFSTAKIVTRTRINVTLIHTLPDLFRKRIGVYSERHFGSSNTLDVSMQLINVRVYGTCSYHRTAEG
jgi:hypothetical protein